MKLILLLLFLAASASAQTERPMGLAPSIPIGQMWELGGGTSVAFEERDGKRGLWAGTQLLGYFGSDKDSNEEIREAIEDDGWLLLRMAWKVEHHRQRSSMLYYTYTRLILLRPGPNGTASAKQLFAANSEAMKPDGTSIEKLESFSHKGTSATVDFRKDLVVYGKSTVNLLTEQVTLGEPKKRPPLPELPPQGNDVSSLFFPEADAEDVGQLYITLARTNAIGFTALIGASKISIDSPPETVERRIEILEAAILKAGIGLVDVNPGTVCFVNLLRAPTPAELPAFTEAEDLPRAERLVNFIYHTKARPPGVLIEMLKKNRALDFAATRILSAQADETSRTIVFAGPSGALRKVAGQLRSIDIPLRKEAK